MTYERDADGTITHVTFMSRQIWSEDFRVTRHRSNRLLYPRRDIACDKSALKFEDRGMADSEAIREFIRATGIDPAPFARALEEKIAPFALALREHSIPLAELFQRRIPDLYRAAENVAALERQVARASLPHPAVGIPNEERASQRMRTATPASIREALRRVYDHAETMEQKPPNVNQVVNPVKELLQPQGLTTTKDAIQREAAADEFKRRRLDPGRHRLR